MKVKDVIDDDDDDDHSHDHIAEYDYIWGYVDTLAEQLSLLD